jgi:hypothetical protein
VRKSFGENANNLNNLIGMYTKLNEFLRMCGRCPVGAQVHCCVGIVYADQPDGALHALQQLEVDTGRLADLPRRDVAAVVTHQPPRRHQHGNRRASDLVGRDALLKQPLDQFGPLGPSAALQTVKQLVDTRVDTVVHVANV